MTDTQADYVRTDQLDDALVPLAWIRERFSIPERTLRRRLANARITAVPYNGGKALRWGDVVKLLGKPKE